MTPKMFDVERFIGCIQKRAVLWDRDHEDYTDRNTREKAWAEIGAQMFDEWLNLDAVQHVEKVKEMKGKWRHIRDNFNKFLTQERTTDTGVKRKKYIYADHCGFLINSIGQKKTVNNTESPDDFDDRGRKGKTTEEGDQNLNSWLLEESSETRSSEVKIPRSGRRQQVLKKLEHNFWKEEEEDADKSFLMSLLPDYRKLSSEEKTQFKLMTVQFFDRAQQKFTENQQCLPLAHYSQNPYASTNPFNYPHPVFSVQTFYPVHSSLPMVIQPSFPIMPPSSLSIPSKTLQTSLVPQNIPSAQHLTEIPCSEVHNSQFDEF